MNGKLTLKEKKIIVNTLHWTSEYNFRIQEDAYGNKEAWEILDEWLSQVLGVDFKKDIYGSVEVMRFNRIEDVKQTVSKMGSRSWFIGDNLKDILASMCWQKHDSEEQILDAELLVKETWKAFLDLYNGSSKIAGSTEYVESGIVVNGEMLYKRLG
jgi:hypothetical protein